jgi:hypothetical protein
MMHARRLKKAEHTYSTLATRPKIEMFEADHGHGYSHPRRMAAHCLRDKDNTAAEVPVAPESAETLFCTPTRQVVTSLGGETVFTLNRAARAKRLRESGFRLADATGLTAYQGEIR